MSPTSNSPMTGDDLPEFDLAGDLPSGMTVLEASAGTGKTYALTALVARFIAERPDLTVDQVLMVTFTRAAATEMKDRVRLRLFDLQGHLAGTTPLDDPWVKRVAECDAHERAQRLARVRTALSSLDSASITTIHGFCQQTIREMGVSGGDLAAGEVAEGDSSIVEQRVRDGLLQRLGADPSYFGTTDVVGTPTKVEKSVLSVLKAHASNAGSRLAPALDASCDSETPHRWVEFVQSVMADIEQSRIASGRLSFDDLISGMRRVVEQRPVVIRVRQQYRLVLIDEFQDTDASQWGIFERLFLDDPTVGASPTVVCVGDPKQAIYRFRGADIAAYLDAIARPGVIKFKMATNWRTDRPLVEAMNTLMHSMSLGGDEIRYVQVSAAATQQESALAGGGEPFQIRWVEKDDDDITADIARPAIATDLVNHVVELLSKGRLRRGEHEVAVKPGDIAVLVRSHRDAEPVLEALRRRGIPAVRSRLGTVAETEAMAQMQLLAAAIAGPANARLVRSLALTWFVDVQHSDVLSDEVVENLQARCARWASLLQRGGAAALSIALRTDGEVLAALARSELERRLTDIEHLLELVQAETRGAPMQPTHLLRVLRSLVDDIGDPEARTRRTDTDADAVQITTMHSSKGLEYPIVLLPYPKSPNLDKPYVYSMVDDDGTKVRYIDAAPSIKWTSGDLTVDVRKEKTKQEIAEDELRLMYVALTRAKHQVVMWWADTDGAVKGSAAQVLFRHNNVILSPPTNDEDTAEYFASLAEHIGPSCGLKSFAHSIEPSNVSVPRHDVSSELSVARFNRDELRRDDWYRWSFSSMMRSESAPTPVREFGGGDEVGPDTGAEATSGEPVVSALLAMPASNHFGTLVHELYEQLDFASPTLEADLAALIEADERVATLDIDPATLCAGLCDVVRTPLVGLYPGTALADIGAGDRLAELEFHFPIVDTDMPLARSAIADLAVQHTTGAVRDYFSHVAATWTDERVRGLMTGSIDAVLRVDGRYTVIDYKSNRVHPKDSVALDGHYSGAGLLEAMASHDYLMQALLYSVALHRFLFERLPDYDPEVHHGGAGYLFIRGMSGPDTPVLDGVVRGLSVWRPPTALLDALDRCFAGHEVLA